MYCSDACKQAAVRARRGVRVARRPPEPQNGDLLRRLAEIEDRQRTLLTDLDGIEQRMEVPSAVDVEALERRVEALEVRMVGMARTIEALSKRQREHETALTKMAELLAAEPWRLR